MVLLYVHDKLTSGQGTLVFGVSSVRRRA